MISINLKGLVKTALILMGLCFFALPVFADSYNAYTDTNQYVYDQTGSTKLPIGSVIQFIYAKDGVIHAPNSDGTPGGGDTLIDSTSRTINYQAGYFYWPLNGLTNGAKIYVRAWNASSLSSATYYGDSALLTVNNPVPNPPVSWKIASFSTNTQKPSGTPIFSKDKTALTYTATAGASNPANQTITISNTGTGTLSWSATNTSSWLTISPASGTLSAGASTIETASVNISGLTAGTYTDTITYTSNGGSGTIAVTLTVSASQQAQPSNIIDDIEGTKVIPSSYYAFGPGNPTTHTYDPSITRTTTGAYLGYSMQATYIATSEGWRGWGGVLANAFDASPYGAIVFYMKGDGSTTNKIKLQLKDSDGDNYAMGDSYAISTSNAGWTKYIVPVSQINTKVSGSGTLNLNAITEYQFVFTGISASSGNGVFIDNIYATNESLSPSVSVNPATLTYTATVGASNPVSQTFTISNNGNAGNAKLTYNIKKNSSWLTVLPTSGVVESGSSSTETASVSISGLSAGTYNDIITVESDGGTKQVNVTLTISAASAPIFGKDKTTLTYTATEGASNPANQTITISNTGTATLTWSATKTSSWLTISPASGTVSAGASTIETVSINITGLTAATYTDTITYTSNGGSGTVAVTLTVTASQPAAAYKVIDNYEGSLVSSYYPFGPTESSKPTATRVISDKYEGSYSMQTTYTATSDGWRGWGGILKDIQNISSFNSISFYMKGDGSTANKIKLQLKDLDGDNFAMSDSDAISTSNSSGWVKYTVPISKINNRIANGSEAGSDGSLDLSKIAQYQFVFTGTAASSGNGVFVDYVYATNEAVSENPVLSVTPQSLTFTATEGASNPANQTITISNTGTGTLSWSATKTSSWLGISPISSSISSSSSTTETVSINITGLTSGTYTDTITYTSNGGSTTVPVTLTITASGAGTIPPATIEAIDDFEGNLVSPSSGYYTFGPNTSAYPSVTRETSQVHEGSYGMQTTYSAISDPSNSWRGWGGILNNTKDLSAYNTISFWMKGDGTSNKVKIQLKDSDGDNFAVADADAISISDTNWKEYKVSISKINVRTGSDGNGSLDISKVAQYQFVFTGTAASSSPIYIDYVTATGKSVPEIYSVSPSSVIYGRKVSITLTGTNLGSGGFVAIEGQGVSMSLSSSATGEDKYISSWSVDSVTFTLPLIAVGDKNIKIIRSDSETSNTKVLSILAASAEGNASYNYPNPFNPLAGQTTRIVFNPQGATTVFAYIFDSTARLISKLEWNAATASANEILWDGKSGFSEIVGDGVYLYRVVDQNNKVLGKGKILIVNK